MGSDKDRPPRSDASWSTSSSSSMAGVESSADRLDNARIRQSAADVSETRYKFYTTTSLSVMGIVVVTAVQRTAFLCCGLVCS